MLGVLYSDHELGSYWRPVMLELTIKEVKNQWLKQVRPETDSHYKIKIADKNISIMATAIVFPNGDMMDIKDRLIIKPTGEKL